MFATLRPPTLKHDAFIDRIKLVCGNTRLVSAGRMVLEESTYSFSGFKAAKVDLLADWTVDPHQQRSWQWNTAALNFLPWLIAYHADTGSEQAIDFALKAIRSWRFAARKTLRDYEFANHDHATALRAENVMLFLAYLHREGLARPHWARLARFIDEIASSLEDDAFYNRHTNHGIEQSRILATAADMFPGRRASARRWRIADARLVDELRFAFTSEGVHVENSPAYHQYVCDAFLKIGETLPRARLAALNDAVDEIMPKAMGFLAHVIRPGGKFPIIGDTGRKIAVNPFGRYAHHVEYQWLDHVASGRVRGTPPNETMVAFPQAGYLIARDRWKRPGARGREFHLIMKCGCKSRYHRHDDDFNIVMMCGEDWLIDGGAYSYAELTPIRRYLRSKWAHNVPVVDRGERWPRLAEEVHRASLAISTQGDVVLAEADSDAYPGFRATRNLELHPKQRRFVVDDHLDPVAGHDAVTFRSLWHVPAKKDIFRRGQDILVCSRKNTHAMRIRNVGTACDSVGVLRPNLEHYANAVVSWRAHHLDPAKIIAFSTRATALRCRLEFELIETGAADLEGWERL